jgi:hypothetical protein
MFSLLIFIISVNMDHSQTTQLFFDHCNSFSRFESTMTNPLELLVFNQPWSKGIDAREERNHWDRGLMPWIQMNIADVIAIRTTASCCVRLCVWGGGSTLPPLKIMRWALEICL